MKNSVPAQLALLPMPHREIRGLSFTSAIRRGLRPYEYKSIVAASCLEAVLDFKIWEKRPALDALPGHIHGRKVCAVRP